MLRINKYRCWLDPETMEFKAEYLMDDGCLCTYDPQAIADLRYYCGIDPLVEIEIHENHVHRAICIPSRGVG